MLHRYQEKHDMLSVDLCSNTTLFTGEFRLLLMFSLSRIWIQQRSQTAFQHSHRANSLLAARKLLVGGIPVPEKHLGDDLVSERNKSIRF